MRILNFFDKLNSKSFKANEKKMIEKKNELISKQYVQHFYKKYKDLCECRRYLKQSPTNRYTYSIRWGQDTACAQN